jgi:hypothetical protein
MLIILAIIFLSGLLTGSGSTETLRFVFISDSRGTTDGNPINTTVLQDLNSQILKLSPRPSFVFFGGDQALWGMKYDGYIYNFQAFKTAMQPITQATPPIKLYMAIGNHEMYQLENNGTSGNTMWLASQQQYQQAFPNDPTAPGINSPSGYEGLAYSFTSPGGDCFFAVLDPYYMPPGTPSKPGDKYGSINDIQLNWLTTQINQTQAAHKFLFAHVPAYKVTYADLQPSYMNLFTLLNNNHFNIYFAGHEHLFSRKTIDQAIGNERNPPDPRSNKVVQVINGGGGAPEDSDPLLVDGVARHVHRGAYYYTVVDVVNKQVLVHTYGGQNGSYSLVDAFTNPQDIGPVYRLLLIN